MGFFRQIAEYLYIKKREPGTPPPNRYVKYMHGMNRISIFMFLIALIIMILRFVIVPLFKK
jgi:hypothetical protein